MTQLVAAFMAIGLSTSQNFAKAHEHIDIGYVDMVDSCIHYAGYVDALGDAGFGITGDYPGVFLYEVAEEAGDLCCAALLECKPGHYPDAAEMQAKLQLLAYDFFKQGIEHRGNPETLRAELVRALAAVEFEVAK